MTGRSIRKLLLVFAIFLATGVLAMTLTETFAGELAAAYVGFAFWAVSYANFLRFRHRQRRSANTNGERS
jgi:uncharacterized membrane protein